MKIIAARQLAARLELSNRPGRTRTCNPRFWSPLLATPALQRLLIFNDLAFGHQRPRCWTPPALALILTLRKTNSDAPRDEGRTRSARLTRARAPSLRGLSPAREERGHEPALGTGLDCERGQRQGDRESDVRIVGAEGCRTAKRGMRFVHPHRRVLKAAELKVVGPVAVPDRESGMDGSPWAGRCRRQG